MSTGDGWNFLNSDDDSNSPLDGSWGERDSDGSRTYFGADGSWGYENSDGSGSFFGADGSWGYKEADGSGSYWGEDGSWGYTDSDGSSSFFGVDGGGGFKNSGESGYYVHGTEDSVKSESTSDCSSNVFYDDYHDSFDYGDDDDADAEEYHSNYSGQSNLNSNRYSSSGFSRRGHSLVMWIIIAVFCPYVGIPFIIYYSVSPNHFWF